MGADDLLTHYAAARFYLAIARSHGSADAVRAWTREVRRFEAAIGAVVGEADGR